MKNFMISMWINHKVLIIGIILFLIPIVYASLSPNDRYKQTSRKCIVEGSYIIGRYQPTFKVFLVDEKNRHFTLETDDYTYFQAYKNRVMYFKLSDEDVAPEHNVLFFFLGLSLLVEFFIILFKSIVYFSRNIYSMSWN